MSDSDNGGTAQTVAPIVPDSSSTTSTTNPVEEIAKIADDLQPTSLPLGWSKQFRFEPFSLSALTHAVGWLVTATLITLGAPFWFDLLTRLVSLRGTGGKPALATDDDDLATARVVAKPKP